MSINIRFISAGAGSGKTYRLTEELEAALTGGRARPEGIIGTTFTRKAARELRERVSRRLIQSGRIHMATRLGQSLLGTVNSVCGRLLSRFAFEAGLSPEIEVMPEGDDQLLFYQAAEGAISVEDVGRMNALAERLGFKDWRNEVGNIVSTARANDMAASELPPFGRQSADELLAFFPPPAEDDLWAALYDAVAEALAAIRQNEDATVGTRKYVDTLEGMLHLIRDRRLAWSQWAKLSKAQPTLKSRPLAEPVREVALRYDSHPMLHSDIREFCESLFRLAASSMAFYQDLKKGRGLMDFVDQEQLTLHVLDLPEVQEILNEELDLLLVDEFQDTSPIQLALFLKLARLAKEAVFVGDIKQAIYGFRGSDPELMQAVLKEVESRGGQADILERSWRSRPALVAYTNHLFVRAFSGYIPEEQVILEPQRQEKTDAPAVVHWGLMGGRGDQRDASLAVGIAELAGTGYPVVDKASGELRPVTYQDIAVLARTHRHIASLAGELAAAGIPVQMERPGLLATPEACLALACLRRAADPRDTLASAEIIALGDGIPAEAWIENRLDYLASDRPSHLWGEDGDFEHPVVSSIARHRGELSYLTPSEALSRIINIADIRRTVSAWGPSGWRTRQRLQNVDALVERAVEYEEHCRSQRQAATIAGLLSWVADLGEALLDMQPGDTGSDAVHVLTHHGAKGLEWPVVIAADLNGPLWPGVWGLNVVSESEAVDLQNPLAGRSIRFWPYPFGSQRKDVPIAERIEGSEIGRACAEKENEEDKRLLYVSLTRARDLLVIPLPEKKPTGPWMELVGSERMLPTGMEMKLDDGRNIPCDCRVFDGAESGAGNEMEAYRPHWFDARREPSAKLPAVLHPSEMGGLTKARVVETRPVGMILPIRGSWDANQAGSALHLMFAAAVVNPRLGDELQAIERILGAYSLESNTEPGEVRAYISHFLVHLKESFKPVRLLAEYPVREVLANGQVVTGWVDLLLETADGWVIVDHKVTGSQPADWEKEALKHSAQLEAYRQAVQVATGKEVGSAWIHFPIAGRMHRVISG